LSFVVDASAAAAWFFEDETTPWSESLLEATRQGGVWAPGLWPLEICNLLLMAQRRQRISSAQRMALLAAAAALPVRLERAPLPLREVDALAARHQLTAYDAAYLELALRRGLPLATRDERLLHAMRAEGVAAR
jgi:predicted nucleic acid-binding protein